MDDQPACPPSVAAAGAPSTAAARTIEALLATAHAIQRFVDARIAHCAVPAKLSGARLRVLFAVAQTGRLRMGDLATELGISARTVTDLVDGLEREGFIARQPDPTDRRATLLELSPTALQHFAQMRTLQEEFSEAILAPLDDEQRRQFEALLQRLQQGPIGELESRAPACSD